MRDVYEDGSVLILEGSEVWIGGLMPEPTIVLFEVDEDTYLIEHDATDGAAFEQLEAMSSIDESFYFENSADFYKLDEMAFLMLRMVL